MRGGAGFIKVTRLSNNQANMQNLINLCSSPLTEIEGYQIIDNLTERSKLSDLENKTLKRAISTKALNNPLNMEDMLRANILKEIIIEVMKRS